MKKYAILLVLFSLTFCLVEAATIEGKIVNTNSGTPIAGAMVDLFRSGKLISTTKTKLDGQFVFAKLTRGTYSIKVKAKGFKPLSQNKVALVDDQAIVLNLRLMPLIEVVIVEEDLEEEIFMGIADPQMHMVQKQGMHTGHAQSYRNQYSDPGFIQYNTESYDVINENLFKEVLDNPLSTFSVDVDRASYANVRRFLNQSTPPPKDAVRVEELINYFDYDYPQPQSKHPFSINFETHACPWNTGNELVMIGIQGKEMDMQEIPPSNLVFLIDVSGSMSAPNKLPLLRQAFKILVEKLRPEDRVAMVVYAGAAGVVLKSTPGNNKATIVNALDHLQAGGSTAGGAGIKLAYQIAKEHYIPKGNNRVILATDGDFNIGASSNAEMVRLIEKKRDEGVFLSVLGFGMGNYKDSKMEAISNAGNGNYAYIDNILEAKKVFGKELWGTLYTIAKDVKIQVEFNPTKVKAYRLIGYENRILNKEDFNDDKKDAGDIGSGHSVTALYEIIPADSEEEVSSVDPLMYQTTQVIQSKDLMTIKLRYKQPDEGKSTKLVRTVKINTSSNPKMSNNFRFASSVAAFGMLLRKSEHASHMSFDQVIHWAKAGKGKDEDGYRQEFITLVSKAQLLVK